MVPIGIVAAQLRLPDGRATIAEALAAGRLRARDAQDLGHDEVPVSEGESPPELAVAAARTAVEVGRIDPLDIDLICHAWMYYQGHDMWSPAHYVAGELGARNTMPVGIQQMCNGGSAALELAAARLSFEHLVGSPLVPGPNGRAVGRLALVTTGDRFDGPGFDRWRSDYGVAYGDAGTAVLLRVPAAPEDPLLLRAIATVAAPELELMHRGDDPFGAAARTVREVVDMRATKRVYLKAHGSEAFVDANRAAIRRVVATALADSGLAANDSRLRYALLPRFGRKTLDGSWFPMLTDALTAELVDIGRDTGHLGAGDATASVADLLTDYKLAPGEAALVFSAGAGFTWSCVVVQAPY
ncbi:3-oxoacyl-ACP synthase [Nocardia terpenica]|uniref:3-oxoacyl-[acyl-carrier-protein] synthase III C-terminal domain-containing protein n=1 Tax=Nocardia terpenica TaxID=455432 RepID=UPI002FE00A47